MAVGAALRSQHQSSAGIHAERIDVLVVCNDDSLLIELGPLLGDRYRVHAVDTLANLGDQVASIVGQSPIARWIGVVDVDSQTGARGAVSRLGLQHPGCPLIVIASRPEDWADRIARGTVLAAIGRGQIATARLSEALLAAGNRLRADGRLEQVLATEAPDAAMRPGAGPDRFGMSPQWRAQQRRGALWVRAAVLLLGVLGLVVLGLAALGVTRERLQRRQVAAARGGTYGAAESGPLPTGTVATNPDAAGPAAAQPQNVLELLSAARVAFREQRWLPPRAEGGLRGDSALELYIQVLRQDPQNDEALAGVKRLLVIGRDRITADAASTTDAAGADLEDANGLVALFKAAGVSAADLQPLVSVIDAARPKWLAQRAAENIAAGDFATADQQLAEASASGADTATIRALRTQEAAKKLKLQLTAMAAQVNRAIRAGALLPPAMDNALAPLTAMRSIGRSHPLTLQAQDAVQTALVQAGERATGAEQFTLAQRDLNAAAQLGSFAPLAYARRQLQLAETASQRRAAVSADTVRRAGADAARAPATVSTALATAPAPPPYIAAQPTRPLPLRYPYGVSGTGSVIVEFTLAANGSASDVTVVQADRPGVFDRAAISAVRHGRYSTRELVDGRPVRARIKLRFNTD